MHFSLLFIISCKLETKLSFFINISFLLYSSLVLLELICLQVLNALRLQGYLEPGFLVQSISECGAPSECYLTFIYFY